MEEKKSKRGRKKIYDGPEEGAPRLITRIEPALLAWAKAQPEGIRAYVERIIREDRDTRQAAADP